MSNFKKAYEPKILSLALSISLLFASSIYSSPASKDVLRVPVGGGRASQRIVAGLKQEGIEETPIVQASLRWSEEAAVLIDVLQSSANHNGLVPAMKVWEALPPGLMTFKKAYKILDKLAKVHGSGVEVGTIKERQSDGHLRKITGYRYVATPTLLSWNNVKESDLPACIPFRRHNGLSLINFIWDDPEEMLKRHNARSGYSHNYNEMSEFVVRELLEIYRILDSEQKALTPKEILSGLRERRIDIFLDDERVIGRALRWLEMQGFPVLRAHNKWLVSGVERSVLVSPEEAFQRKGDISLEAVGERIRMAISDRDLKLTDIDRIMAQVRPDINVRNFIYALTKEEVSPAHLDKMLEALSKVLGIEAIWFRTGYTRAEYEEKLYPELPDRSIRQRVKEFRNLEGITRRQLALRLGWKVRRVEVLEQIRASQPLNEYEVLQDAGDWPILVQALGLDDSFLVLIGRRREDMPELIKKHIIKQGEALRVCRLSKGLTEPEFAKRVGVSVPTVVSWELHGLMPLPEYREELADLYGFSVEELFSPDSFKTFRFVWEHFRYAEKFSVRDISEQRKMSDNTVRSDMRGMIRLRLARRVSRGYYTLTYFASKLTMAQAHFICNMPELTSTLHNGGGLTTARDKIYSNIQNLVDLEGAAVFFFMDEIDRSPAAFREALEQLRDHNSIVVLIEDDYEAQKLGKILLGELKLPPELIEKHRAMTYQEVGISKEEANSYRMQVLGVDDLHCCIDLDKKASHRSDPRLIKRTQAGL